MIGYFSVKDESKGRLITESKSSSRVEYSSSEPDPEAESSLYLCASVTDRSTIYLLPTFGFIFISGNAIQFFLFPSKIG